MASPGSPAWRRGTSSAMFTWHRRTRWWLRVHDSTLVVREHVLEAKRERHGGGERARGACLVVGAGDGLGAAIARAFARRGADRLRDAARAPCRQSGGAGALDPRRGRRGAGLWTGRAGRGGVVALVERIEREVGPLEVVVFNIGANVRFPVAETTTQVYSKVWEMACLAGFLTGREAARAMAPRGRGTILSHRRDGEFARRRGLFRLRRRQHGSRAPAQSLARETGPQGVHVAHVVVDGMIDGDFIRSIVPDAEQRLAREEILRPEEIARNYVWLHRRLPVPALTFELDLRPWAEHW